MSIKPLEADTRFLIDRNLQNLGWRFEGIDRNVYLEQPRSEKERKKLQGKRPDYVLYSKEDDRNPLIIIEAKKKGERIDTALEQGIRYAKALEAPIVFATDGLFCKSHHTKFDKTPILNGEEVDEFLREALALRYLNTWEVNTISPKVRYSRRELIKIFDEANNMLRGDGLRAGIERFGEFANILFLKLISENEDIKKLSGEESEFDYACHWDYIKNLKPSSRIEHINKIVYEKLNALYKTEIFTPLSVRDTDILKDIMDKLDPLTLTDVDSDVKGDAFEYFLRESTASGNDLGEYFTPRHIVKTMVKLVNPQIGEKVYDPFCGTGGFLIESFRHIWNTMPRNELTNKMLRENTIFGNEITNTARITKMNMILAGDGHSGIHMRDSLANPIDGKYDVVLANMPYSQRTKHGNLYDLPTTNGDSICVQHCMKAISSTADNGRMAIVVPEGFLFRKDLAKTREFILKNCNLQSIISLPQGVFLPYTGVKTNIIYATKVNQKLSSREKRKDYWYFDVKSDGYSLDNHRRKLDTESDLDIYQEYRKLDDDQRQEMLDVGFEIIPLEKVKENSYILAGSRYRKQKRLSSSYTNESIGSLCKIMNGYSFPLKLQSKTGSVPFYKVSDMNTLGNEVKMSVSNNYVSEDLIAKKNWKAAPSGTVIFPKIGAAIATNKKRILSVPSLFDNNVMGLICNDKILPKYLLYVLEGIDIAEWASQSNPPSISKEMVENYKIPLPELSFQQLIVDELDSYQSVIDGARKIVESYSPKINIQQDWKPFDLSDIVDEIKPGFACGKHSRNTDGLIHIRPMNITTNGKLTLDDSKFIDPDILTSKKHYLLKKGDILFNNTNSKELVGKTCYIEKDLTAVYSNHITRIRSNSQKNNSKFIAIYLHNIWQSGYFLEYSRKWVGQAGINKGELSKVQIQLPSIEVQNQIVKQIEEEQKLIEPSKQLIKVFTKKIEDRINELFE